ncbi:MarR family winged helix-turn-helix transcriptional regulator [Pseudoponticoccus marisrubri]|uniref:HTH marR-type domain-containing protein n=1 Tax=Pseudoponticoccus marisrubri TaxID=1685382 RepID=A0A0W7WDL4_9RHOB|nr:MarR family transcriptional regulator [Pseudoponticoccus marisrubri]KUF08721.1 hypothetical protein AVJ23_21215 [Pseudoponticoccus marisrubri]
MKEKAAPEKAVPPKQTDMLLRQFIGYNMKRAYLQIQDDMAETLEPLGLRIGTFSALAVIMASPGISQTQLSEVLNIKRSGVVVVVDDLERAGAVQRTPVQTDRRAYALQVTPAGKALWARAEQAVQAHEAALFADLDADERRALQDLLVRAARSGAKHRKGTDG